MHARTGKERLHPEQISLSKHTEGSVVRAPSPGKVRPRLLSRSLELTHPPSGAARAPGERWRGVSPTVPAVFGNTLARAHRVSLFRSNGLTVKNRKGQ